MIELHGTLTVSDLRRFQYFHRFRRLWPIVLLVLLLSISLLVIMTAFPNPNLIANVQPLLILFALWLALLFAAPDIQARLIFSRQPYFRYPMTQTFTSTGYETKGTGFSSEVSWGILRNVRETKSLFLLYHTPQMALVVPKRFFVSDEQMETWEEAVTVGIAPKKLSKAGWVGRLC
jgi:hypothetical protein